MSLGAGKLLAFSGPSNIARVYYGFKSFVPDDYCDYFRRRGITAVVRLNKPVSGTWPTTPLCLSRILRVHSIKLDRIQLHSLRVCCLSEHLANCQHPQWCSSILTQNMVPAAVAACNSEMSQGTSLESHAAQFRGLCTPEASVSPLAC